MEDEKLQELLEPRSLNDQEIEKLRSSMTILFSDIKGSTSYAEKKGDVEYMAMLDRHNRILFPVIEGEGGHVVKTIGDSILARFDDPVAAVRAAVSMQRALAKDGEGRDEIDRIRIRLGLHCGMGLVKDNDVFGDVVNAASRIERQAQAGQVLITENLLDAATIAGFDCAKMGRADMRGKDEPIDLYAVAWSESATRQIIEEIQARYEKRLKHLKTEHAQLEEHLDKARDQWRTERRALNAEIEELEKSIERATEAARKQLSENLQAEVRSQIDDVARARDAAEQELASARQKFEAERNSLKSQLASVEASLIDAIQRSNNQARVATAVREQVEERVAEAKQEWQLQWETDRRRLVAEIERLKKGPAVADEKKEAAKRAVLEKLGKLSPGSAGAGGKTAEQWEREFDDAKIRWVTEREQLNLRVKKLERELRQSQDVLRSEIQHELRGEYEQRIEEANRERQLLEVEMQAVKNDLSGERQGLNARLNAVDDELHEAREAGRKKAIDELQGQFELKIEEANRQRARSERKQQELKQEWEQEKRRTSKEIAALEEQLKEAKESVFMAQKLAGRITAQE
jgi:class 3 adenylate cyclase